MSKAGCFNILGVCFDLIGYPSVMQQIFDWKEQELHKIITITNPHSVILCCNDEQMQKATNSAALTLPDGIGIILAAKILGYAHHGRVSGPDLMLKCCEKGIEKNYRHFFYGGAQGIAEKLAERLSDKYPGLQIAGTYSPPFRQLSEQEDAEIVDLINSASPDILWVGLGAPKQEKWMSGHVGRIKAAAMIGVGAAFDFHSGNIKRAPQWLQNCHLEWLHRLLANPMRMWQRYLVNGPIFLAKVIAQKVFHF
ncbi:MAG: WecB/TagA/CpsF family glycosyltransferase [Planctomycetes bacterium]|nr:WecB/TagA/CpsF family glycosyltransferase [Planctomycetota bacterium]